MAFFNGNVPRPGLRVRLLMLLTVSYALSCLDFPMDAPAPAKPPAPVKKQVAAPKPPVRQPSKWELMAARCGFPVDPNQTTVIGLRGMAPDGRRHPSSDNMSNYDDTFILIKNGQVKVFLGSTHAGQPSSSYSPDGVAQIKPGRFRAVPCGEYADMPCWLVTTQYGIEHLPCWRDADRDGYISEAEKWRSDRVGHTASEILFHNGRYWDHGSSIGCQTMPPDTMRKFIELVGVDQSFDYILIDVNA